MNLTSQPLEVDAFDFDGKKRGTFKSDVQANSVEHVTCLGSQQLCYWEIGTTFPKPLQVVSLDGHAIKNPKIVIQNGDRHDQDLVRCRGQLYNFTDTGYTIITPAGSKQNPYKTKDGKKIKLEFGENPLEKFELVVPSDDQIIFLAANVKSPQNFIYIFDTRTETIHKQMMKGTIPSKSLPEGSLYGKAAFGNLVFWFPAHPWFHSEALDWFFLFEIGSWEWHQYQMIDHGMRPYSDSVSPSADGTHLEMVTYNRTYQNTCFFLDPEDAKSIGRPVQIRRVQQDHK
eukprot:TRINITY_DN1216_c0_g1_i3.p1 TRINITY_DN1216_c0_g1~~TRINITY_DN1216_c0_g1_i3.p1  ORF type:complete len:286 (+),score=49.53 TRINITY_DN1216_c0_g1_i3:363-1220(+)